MVTESPSALSASAVRAPVMPAPITTTSVFMDWVSSPVATGGIAYAVQTGVPVLRSRILVADRPESMLLLRGNF